MSEGSNRPDRETRLKHLAIALADNAERDRIKIKRAFNRKMAQGAGIKLEDLDFRIKVADWSPAEIAEYFAGKLDFLADMDIDLGTQFDLFSGPKPTATKAPGWKAAGLFAGIGGKDPKPPTDLSQFEAQQWMEGWHEGQKYLGQGMELRALQNREPTTEAAVPAASDEVEALPGALEEWDDDHQEVFNDWYVTIPADVTPTMTNGAVAQLFASRRREADEPKLGEDQVAEAGGAPGDDFEATPEELAKQKPRAAAKAAKKGETN